MSGNERLDHELDEVINGSISSQEIYKRRIQEAIGEGNLLVSSFDEFIVMGINGLDGSMFACGSASNVEDAQALASLYFEDEYSILANSNSDDDYMPASFHVFTLDGNYIPPIEEVEQ